MCAKGKPEPALFQQLFIFLSSPGHPLVTADDYIPSCEV
jgi:hypothetical protein